MSPGNQIPEVELSRSIRPIDRRESPRCDTQLQVMFPNGRYETKNGNLGLGGCYFTTNYTLSMGQTIRINLDPDLKRNHLEVDCRVIRLVPLSRETGVAAKFDNLPFEVERAIARWLDYQ